MKYDNAAVLVKRRVHLLDGATQMTQSLYGDMMWQVPWVERAHLSSEEESKADG